MTNVTQSFRHIYVYMMTVHLRNRIFMRLYDQMDLQVNRCKKN